MRAIGGKPAYVPAYPIREAHIDLDWAALYGPEWSVVRGATAESTVLAVGSEIAVYPFTQ